MAAFSGDEHNLAPYTCKKVRGLCEIILTYSSLPCHSPFPCVRCATCADEGLASARSAAAGTGAAHIRYQSSATVTRIVAPPAVSMSTAAAATPTSAHRGVHTGAGAAASARPACWLWLGRPASAAGDTGHQRMLYHTSSAASNGEVAAAAAPGAGADAGAALPSSNPATEAAAEALLQNIEDVRANGLKPHKKVYHRTLGAVLDAHPDDAMPEQARVLLEWMAADHGRRLTATVYSRLLQRCKTKDHLLSVVADLSKAKHFSGALASDAIRAYLRTVKHMQSTGKPRLAAAGDTAAAVVSLLKEMYEAGVRLDGVSALKLMQYLVDVKLRGSAEQLYRIYHQTINRGILLDLIKLCATDRTERRLVRHRLHGGTGSNPTRYWSQSELRRREEYRGDGGAPGFKAIRFATQLWMRIEKGYPSKKSKPTASAHKTFLLTLCKRGDLVGMRQAHALLASRYPEIATTAEIRTLLLKGCVVAGSPEEALAYMDWFDVDATTADCVLLFQTARTITGYRYLSSLVSKCWEILEASETSTDVETPPAPGAASATISTSITLQERVQWLDDLLLASCTKIVQHEDRRRQNEFTALPVPRAETLIPFECQEKLTSVVQLRAKAGSDLTPDRYSLSDLINDDEKAAAARGHEIKKWTRSPLLKQMKRDKLPHLSPDLRWDLSDGSEDAPSRKGTPRATLATADARDDSDGDGGNDFFTVEDETAAEDGPSYKHPAELDEKAARKEFFENWEDTTSYFAASGVPSDGAGGQAALRPAPTTGGVRIAIGRRSTKYLVVVRRGQNGGKYSPHLFVLDRPMDNQYGQFHFANGEAFGTINEAMLRYSLSENAESCSELGCVFHPK